MMRACGRAKRRPLAPDASRIAPIDAACPTQYVATGHFTIFIVSRMASPAVTLPPGELMYIETSFSASCACTKRSSATTAFAVSSSISPPTKTIRSLRRRE